MDFNVIKDEIIHRLKKELPTNLYYHNFRHTLQVVLAVEKNATFENLKNPIKEDLMLAALFHDTGYFIKFENNEVIGSEIAHQYLSKLRYPEKRIKFIKEMIRATQMPQNPKNLYEAIICDADLDYLGTDFDVFNKYSNLLCKEFLAYNQISNKKEWYERQVLFLKNHHYFTRYAQNNREAKKLNNLKCLTQK